MKIRTRLALIFILLMIFGVSAVSSFSILYIRAFLLESGLEEMVEDARWMAQSLNQMERSDDLHRDLTAVAEAARYELQLYDEDGSRVYAGPGSTSGERTLPENVIRHFEQEGERVMLDEDRSDGRIAVYGTLEAGAFPGGWFSINKDEELLYEPVATMRWIIYTGMFISIGVILLVSTVVARNISRPIVDLSKAASRIAEGDITHTINLNRKDEFGELADSLNQMAEHLRSDNERLMKINEKQRQFFADIAHEIRNPLHTMMGSLEMLDLDKLDDQTRKKYVANARGQAERLSQLFKDIITLQRFDSDRNFIEYSNFDLSKVVKRACNWYQYLAEENNITLKYTKTPCNVRADKAKIEQVLDNLLSNALKFTNEGEVEVWYEEQGKEVLIEVTDTGIGIPEEHHQRLFDRFYRTDKARSRDKGGTGLGLAVVKSILESHGKDIYIESSPGKGSRFYFMLDRV